MPAKFYPDPLRFAGVIKSRFSAITHYAVQRTTTSEESQTTEGKQRQTIFQAGTKRDCL